MGLYLEGFVCGARYVTPTRTVTETDVVMFAGMSGDYNELHTSETWARDRGPFGRRIAHGLLCLGIGHALMTRLGILDGTAAAFLGLEEWRFVAPVFFGDTLHVEFAVLSARPSRSHPDRGIVVFGCEYRGEAVFVVGPDDTLRSVSADLTLDGPDAFTGSAEWRITARFDTHQPLARSPLPAAARTAREIQ